jgi:hypothetical protein
LFQSLPPTVQSANTYYLSLSNSGKKIQNSWNFSE